MARFVLVHGGFSGAWIWLPLMEAGSGYPAAIAAADGRREHVRRRH
jgi:hypothetical protein